MHHFRLSVALLILFSAASSSLAATQEYYEKATAAIRHHDLGQLQAAVDADHSVLEYRDSTTNFSLLAIAAMNGDAKACSYLLSKQIDPNVLDAMRMTPARWAVVARSVDALKVLADAGANLHPDDSTDYMLSDAIIVEDIPMVKFLLSKGFSPNQHSAIVNSPLRAAAYVGSIEIMKILLAAGAAVSVREIDGENALSTACSKGKLDVVRFLLDHGADVNAKLPISAAPMVRALKAGDVPLFKLLVEHGIDLSIPGIGIPAFCTVARYSDDTAFLDILLAKRQDINGVERTSGATPLQLAIRYQHRKVARWLIAHGVRLDKGDPGTDSPTELCVHMSEYEIMQMIQSRK